MPVLQISMPTLDPRRLLEIGRRLAPLRDEGVLIIGCGFFTHNLRASMPTCTGADAPAPGWSAEFDDWAGEALDARRRRRAARLPAPGPAGAIAHPRTEHFAPLFVTLGAGEDDLTSHAAVIDGFWMGLAKRSVQLG